jgi:hypothetical protein
VANAGTHFPTLPDRQPPIFLAARDACQDSIEEIQSKLLSIALQQARIQVRIRTLRHAICALIHAFGPTILYGEQPVVCETSHTATCGQPPMIDLCRTILRESKQWLTLSQIHDAIRFKYPSSTARFLKPGTALSNALRTLHRHRVIETKLNAGIREWRAVSEPANLVSERHGSEGCDTNQPSAACTPTFTEL